MNDTEIQKALKTIAHSNLYELVHAAVKKGENPVVSGSTSKTLAPQQSALLPLNCSEHARALGYHLTTNNISTYKATGLGLKFSMRQLGDATEELVCNEFVKRVWVGKSLFLAPTEKLYKALGLSCPYKRNVSVEHSFLILLLSKLLETNPLVQRVEIEVPIGVLNYTSDLGVWMKNGDLIAYELVLSCSNVAKTLAKYEQNKQYIEICFVCRDHQMRDSVWTILRDAGFAPDLFSKVRCTIISALMRQNKNLCLENSNES